MLLGYDNAAKFFRRFDKLLMNNVTDAEFVERIRTSTLGGAEFEEALIATIQKQKTDRREEELSEELRRRKDFVPHIWAEHERAVPQPLYIVAIIGLAAFKHINLSDVILAIADLQQRLCAVQLFIRDEVSVSEQYRHIRRNSFGEVVAYIYRETFDHAFSLHAKTGAVIDEHLQPIVLHSVGLRLR